MHTKIALPTNYFLQPVEADQIVSFMLGKAREHGIDDTMLAVAYASLKA